MAVTVIKTVERTRKERAMKSVVSMKNPRLAMVDPNSESIVPCRIIGKEDGDYLILTEDGRIRNGKKADGCLMQPEINDRVLVWQGRRDEVFILSVLVKANDASCIVFKGDTTIEAVSGVMNIEGETVEIAASRVAHLQAPEMNLDGRTGRIRFIDLSLIAATALAHMERASLIVDKMDSILGRLTEHIKNSFRRVEHLDQTKAGHISHIAEKRYSVKAGHASIIADDDVKIDGEKIHLG
ncbi:MAG: hypothetical protein CSYNP_00787 [Syntrophus sp. SKADARSKE-3]|nr:hypothetical protein [Syntrophus sp. SKADARSKE-3]